MLLQDYAKPTDFPLYGITCDGCGKAITDKHVGVTATKVVEDKVITQIYHGCCLLRALDQTERNEFTELLDPLRF